MTTMTREKVVHLRLSDMEYDALKKKAMALGMNPTTYIRYIAMKPY